MSPLLAVLILACAHTALTDDYECDTGAVVLVGYMKSVDGYVNGVYRSGFGQICGYNSWFLQNRPVGKPYAIIGTQYFYPSEYSVYKTDNLDCSSYMYEHAYAQQGSNNFPWELTVGEWIARSDDSWGVTPDTPFRVQCMPRGDRYWARAGVCTEHTIEDLVIQGQDVTLEECYNKCENATGVCQGFVYAAEGCYPKSQVCGSPDPMWSSGGGVTFSIGLVSRLSLGKTASQSSTIADWEGGEASLAVDGDTRGDFINDNTCTHTQKEDSPWWALDLGEVQLIDGVIISNRHDCCGDRLSDFIVGGVADLAPLYAGDFSGVAVCVEHAGTLGSNRKSIDCTKPVAASYLIIYIPGPDQILTLCEVEVFYSKAPRYTAFSSLETREDAIGTCRANMANGSVVRVESEDEHHIVQERLKEFIEDADWTLAGPIWTGHVAGDTDVHEKELPYDQKWYQFDMSTFASCESSSDASGYACSAAHDGNEGTSWITDDNVGASFKLVFQAEAIIHQVRILQRFNWQSNFKDCRISFSDGDDIDVVLVKRNGSDNYDEVGLYWDEINFPERRTRFVNLYFTSTYGNSENGLTELKVMGRSVYGVNPHDGKCLGTPMSAETLDLQTCVMECLDSDACAAVTWYWSDGTMHSTCQKWSAMCETTADFFHAVTFEKTYNGGSLVKMGYCISYPYVQLAWPSTTPSIAEVWNKCRYMKSCRSVLDCRNSGCTQYFVSHNCARTGTISSTSGYISLYKRSLHEHGAGYLGCYAYPEDSTEELPVDVTNSIVPFSHAACVNKCGLDGYKYAGVNFRNYVPRCVCGDLYGTAGERADQCMQICLASTATCGNSAANEVFATNPGMNYAYDDVHSWSEQKHASCVNDANVLGCVSVDGGSEECKQLCDDEARCNVVQYCPNDADCLCPADSSSCATTCCLLACAEEDAHMEDGTYGGWDIYAKDRWVGRDCRVLTNVNPLGWLHTFYDGELYSFNKYSCDTKLPFVCERPYDYCVEETPCGENATCIPLENGFNCTCPAGFDGAQCEINIDDCADVVCENGGQCVDEVEDYHCDCADGFTHGHCEDEINECASSPCLFGSTCNDAVASYSCDCLDGWSGSTCGNNIDECISSPCQNDGICQDAVDAFQCVCIAGYSGNRCETDIDECLFENYACENGGTCIDGIAEATCECVPGFEGVNCQDEILECASSPCINGGTCLELINKFECQCVNGYSGMDCHHEINECLSSPCQNHGSCVDLAGTYSCDCLPGFGGQRCDEYLGNPGTWTVWGNFTDCSKTCGVGLQTRRRECVPMYAELGVGDCGDRPDSMSQMCDAGDCPPTDGNWGAWYPAESCSTTCGPGIWLTNRRCDTPSPQFGGENCTGIDSSYQTCMTQPCPDYRLCGEWGEWSACSHTCGVGERSRSRTCQVMDGLQDTLTGNSSALTETVPLTEIARAHCQLKACGGSGNQCHACIHTFSGEGSISSDGCTSAPARCGSGEDYCAYIYTNDGPTYTLEKKCASEARCQSLMKSQNPTCHKLWSLMPFAQYQLGSDISGSSDYVRILYKYALNLDSQCGTCCKGHLCNENALPYPQFVPQLNTASATWMSISSVLGTVLVCILAQFHE